ncbi:MAG: hypothetical protein OHK0053_09410 [Microscillaceae bacterium]
MEPKKTLCFAKLSWKNGKRPVVKKPGGFKIKTPQGIVGRLGIKFDKFYLPIGKGKKIYLEKLKKWDSK